MIPRTSGARRALSLAAATVVLGLGCGEETSSPSEPEPDPGVAGRVDEAGGTLTGGGGSVTLDFPPGAVSDDVEVTVEEASDVSGEGMVGGSAYDFGPDGLTFGEPVELEIRFDEAGIPDGVVERGLAIYKQVDGGWELVESGEVDPDADRVTAEIESFSVYGVLVDPCRNAPPIALGGSVSGALAPGDCASGEGRFADKLMDQYELELTERTAFRVTLETDGHDPFTGTFVTGGRRVSGVARPDGSFTSAVHVFPAGRYDVFASSYKSRDEADGEFVTGEYTLSVESASESPQGCVPFIFVRSGVTVEGEITSDDCEDELDGEPDVTRWVDGYTILAQPGETVTATLTADFRYRVSLWSDSGLIEHRGGGEGGLPAGSTTTFEHTVTGADFITLNPISENHRGTGSYSATLTISGASSVPAPGARTVVAEAATGSR